MKVNSYYSNFMKDHFIFDQKTKTATKKLKNRLLRMNNLSMTGSALTGPVSQSTKVSPLRILEGSQDNKIQERYLLEQRKISKMLKSGDSFNSGTAEGTKPTFYLIDQNDYQFQKKLGSMEMQDKSNLMNKGEILYEQQKSMILEKINTTDYGRFKGSTFKPGSIVRQAKLSQSKLDLDEYKELKKALQQQLQEQQTQKLKVEPSYLLDRRHELSNPMRSGDVTFTEIKCIQKMKKLGKWKPIRNEQGVLQRVDSLVESVYNSEKNAQWLIEEGQSRVMCPHPTEQSESEYNVNITTSSDEDHEDNANEPALMKLHSSFNLKHGKDLFHNQNQSSISVNGAANDKNNAEDFSKVANTDGASSSKIRNMNFFNGPISPSMNPYGYDQVEIAGMQIPSLREYGPYGVIVKGKEQIQKFNKNLKMKHLNEIFRNYCYELQIAPVKFLHYYEKGQLKLINYNVQPNLCLAIACIIPYLTDLEGIKFRNNGIKDDCAALLLKACSVCPKFKAFHFEKNEVNDSFVDILREVITESQENIQELNLASSKNFSKVVSKVCETIKDSYFLTLLDLSNNNLDAISCKYIGQLIRNSQNLFNLNLSYCGIRGHSARVILNNMMLNQSLKYLNLCWNSFASSDYEFGSKIARIIQIHSGLLHIDLTSTQLKREEAMYIAQCLKDSHQIVSCHLSGNHIDYYSRIYLRAHLNAVVQFPFKNSSVIQNTVLSHDRTQIIGLNQIIQSNLPNPKSSSQKDNGPPANGDFNARKLINLKTLEVEGGIYGNKLEGFELTLDSNDQSIETKIDDLTSEMRLNRYLKEHQTRIYDMMHMFDLYGMKKKADHLKKEYDAKYEENKQINLWDINKVLAERNKDKNNEDAKSRSKRKSVDTDFQKALNIIFSAYDDKMISNPMQGFLKDLIFTRYLGHTDIENGPCWRDCNQCWVCEKWDKVQVQFQPQDAIIDLEFQKIFEITQNKQGELIGVKREYENDFKELNPIWEEQLESLDDEIQEQDHSAHKKHTTNLLSSSRPIIREGTQFYSTSQSGIFSQNLRQSQNFQNIQNMNASSERDLLVFNQEIPPGQSSSQLMIKTPEMYDQTIVQLRQEGPVDLQIKDLQGKVLFNSHISSVKMDVASISRQIVPTANLANISSDQQIILSQECIPYRPFTRIQPTQKEQHIIKLPDIYSPLMQSSPVGSKSTLIATSALNSNQNSRKPSPSPQRQIQPMSQLKEYLSVNKQESSQQKEEASSPYDRYEEIQPRIRTKNEILKLNEDIFKGWHDIPESEDVYLVASFNHWFPFKMNIGSKRKVMVKEQNLIDEKIAKEKQLQDQIEIPAHIQKIQKKQQSKGGKKGKTQNEVYITIDKSEELDFEHEKIKVETIFSYINFLPSGKHYFYFIKHGKFYCLSEKFTIRKFKNTNLYMNEITVAERVWTITDMSIKPLNGDLLGDRFDKTRSVFRNFKEENEELLRKMFELDLSYSKIQRVIKNNEIELQRVKGILWQNYSKLKNIFLTCVINSEYPIITWNDFTILCNRCKIVDKICNLSTIDRVYIATNVNINLSNAQNADRDLVRYEFLEILVRLSIVKYKDTGICKTFSEALLKLFQENLFANVEESNPQVFRYTQLYKNEVNDLLVRNDAGLKKLFGLFIHGQKRYMNSRDAIELINQKAELRFLDKQVVKQFGLSKMPHIDAFKEPAFPNRLQFIEFLEFLGRIAFEIFKDHEGMQNEPLHLKYDALLTKLFKIVKFQKSFTYLEPNKQNVVYEVVLNPQLINSGGGGFGDMPNIDKTEFERNSEAGSLASARMGLS